MTCTILEGDSREILKEFPLLLGDVNCVITDPPYGVDFQSRRAETPAGKEFVRDIANDKDLEEAIEMYDEVMDVLLPLCAPQAELYIFTRWDVVGEWIEVARRLERHEFNYKMLLIWDKGIPGMGDIDANWGCGHELILYCKRGRRDMPRRRSGIIHVDKLGSKEHIHPTEKPVPLMEVLIEMSTDLEGLVVDPFAGSGSSIVAAQRLGRQGVGIELDSQYAVAARARLEQRTMTF